MDNNRTLPIPPSLLAQIQDYRQSVRRSKLLEAIGIGGASLLVAFFSLFLLDRWFDTPNLFRGIAFFGMIAGVATIPLAWYRWFFQLSSFESVAKLIRRYQPSMGGSLLGALELAQNPLEQSRSPRLCEAALNQVAESTSKRNLRDFLPPSNHRLWSRIAGSAALVALLIAFLFPSASFNAWSRLLAPFASIERYTFTQLSEVPNRLVVPYGEDFDLQLRLASTSQQKPPQGSLRVGQNTSLDATRSDDAYSFQIPGQLNPTSIAVAIGDASPKIELQPSMRPELERLIAKIELPPYLEIAEPIEKDLRGGTLTAVRGSTLHITSQTNKPIASATANQQHLSVDEGRFLVPNLKADEDLFLSLSWIDTEGLHSKSTFPLQIQTHEDEAPIVFGDGLPTTHVLLESEQIEFTVRALDDFGVRHVGLEWRIAGDEQDIPPALRNGAALHGEVMLAKGSPTAQTLDARANFQAAALGIPIASVEVRLFVEDYLPDRPRTFSPPHLFHILTPSDHANWILDQMAKWQRESLEVRDREMQLLATNRELRALSDEELFKEETRKRLEQQASAEQANGRRLNSLNARGEEILRQAARNPDIDPNHLESWAQMHQTLRDIAANRIPSVVDLLKKSARSVANASAPSKSEQQSAPNLTLQESSQQPQDPSESAPEAKPSAPSPLTLPATSLASAGKEEPKKEDAPKADVPMDQVIKEQEELLAEFQKVADQLQGILGNLEGSTLVKRLKAASREQLIIADNTAQEISNAFGTSQHRLESEQRQRLDHLRQRELQAVEFVSNIIDDMQGFRERRPSDQFEGVLAEIQSEDILGGLRMLSQRVMDHQGLAIADAEYWSDSLDRWAEDIVKACNGSGEGESPPQNKKSIPPAIVLEVMQILEQEIHLRERTRVAEQSKPASQEEEYREKVQELSTTQTKLRDRVIDVRKQLAKTEEDADAFKKEIGMLMQVDIAMQDAVTILSKPDTSAPAIAAETEVIELLLETKRACSKKSGGGTGTNPGGGGSGTTEEAAIAMLGAGVNPHEHREDRGVSQETGSTGKGLPEEFRSGLDEYFQRIERKSPSSIRSPRPASGRGAGGEG